MTRRAYTDEIRLDIVQEYENGTSPHQIAVDRNMPDSSVYGILHKMGAWMGSTSEPELVPTVTTVTVDEHDTVQTIMRSPTPGKKDTWKIDFTGSVTVQAGSIFEAITEAKKLVSVQRITSASLQGNNHS